MLPEEIQSILAKYLRVDSITGTPKENQTDAFFQDFVASVDYFAKHPAFCGSEKIPEDAHGRSVHWALVRGTGPETVVMIHHSDVVSIENYNEHKDWAYHPDILARRLTEDPDSLDADAQKDLSSGKWLFGRGAADMKGGGAVQLALVKAYSHQADLKGNVVVLIVPDEENLSAGMRFGVTILKRLKDLHGLNYRLMINSEPHHRSHDDQGVISQGSIAKMNIFVHVQGILTHVGKIFEGVNPAGIMGRIVARTEMNVDFIDRVGSEMSNPPTWVYLKDSKAAYDVSTPESILGYFNVLNFSSSPETIVHKLTMICREAVDQYFSRYREIHRVLKSPGARDGKQIEWPVHVVTYSQLLEMIQETGKDIFRLFKDFEQHIVRSLNRGDFAFAEANRLLVTKLIELVKRREIFVVVGLSMPFYPGVSNVQMEAPQDYLGWINQLTAKKWRQRYTSQNYFPGISDLSYSSLNYDLETTLAQMKNMPLWQTYYRIPFETIREIQMPCINVGPWGKDYHKIGERVLIEDLMNRTPAIIDHVIRSALATPPG